jgi:hypothetical protein
MVLFLGLAAADAQARFQVGFQDPGFYAHETNPLAQAAYGAIHAVDGSVVVVPVAWANVAPAEQAAGFSPSDPGDPHYRWNSTDFAVRSIAQHHLKVMLVFTSAPTWAQGPGPEKPYVNPGAWDPNPTQFAAFLHAAALRYSGSFPDPLNRGAALPRVQYWEPWNEPNIPGYFSAPDPVSAYRTLLNGAYGAIKAVHHDNVVALGGLAPVSPVPGSIPPLDFGAQLLCLHRVGSGFRANHSCPQRTQFDVFAMHPYSLAATPTKHAYNSGDVLVGDMGKVGALVHTADRLHTAAPRIHHQLWVTEFAWYTNPPNSQFGDADPTAARYVAYSMYEMWKSGVNLVIWLTVLDQPNQSEPGRGLYWSPGQPKLMLQGFAFPVVAGVSRGHGFAWGRVPVSHRVRVAVQHRVGHSWRHVATVRSGSDGIFYVGFGARRNGLYRARVIGGPTSLAYNSTPIPPRRTHLFTIS